MIEDDDRLFLSQGEAFFQPKAKVVSSSNDFIATASDGDRTNEKRRLSITVVGPYSVGEVIGKGSFGEVHIGTNQLTGENIALKFIKKSEILTMGAMARAANEIKCHSILRHNNIIKLEMVSDFVCYERGNFYYLSSLFCRYIFFCLFIYSLYY